MVFSTGRRASRGSRWRLGFGGGSLRLQRVLGFLDQAGKRHAVGDRDLGELAAVQLDVGGLEPLDEAAVAHASLAAGGVQAHDPKAAHVGLLFLAVDIGVLPGMLDRFLGIAEQLGFVAEIALGVFQDFLVSLARRGGVCSTSLVRWWF